MKVQELRIGNYINDNGIVRIVNSVGSFECELENESRRDYLVITENIKGVPLTEEWLVRFGFIKKCAVELIKLDLFKKTVRIKYWDAELVVFKGCGKDGCHWQMQMNGGIITYFDYVHEFQNLVYALTGEELLIIL